MFKNSSLILVSLIAASPSFAGFYVGFGGGPEGGIFHQRTHVVGNSVNPPVDVNVVGAFNVIATNNLAATGGFGSLFAGYGWQRDRYFLAAEINGNLSTLQYTLTNDEYINRNFAETHFTIKSSEGISLLPGFFLADTTLLYGRIGYANGHVKIVEGADPSIQSSTNNLNGVRYGIGMSHEFAPAWAFRMEYSQISYSNINSFTSFPLAGVTKATTISPTTGQVAFEVMYEFDRPGAYSK